MKVRLNQYDHVSAGMRDVDTSRVITLLRDPELSMKAISIRLRCSESSVRKVNDKFKIRDYHGKRITWDVVG